MVDAVGVTKGYGYQVSSEDLVENYNLTRTQKRRQHGNMGDFELIR